MTLFNVQLVTPQGEVSFQCPDDEYILDAAEQAGIDMSYSCRAGACSSCLGRIIRGTLDQSDQSFLDDVQINDKYVILCVAYATSDLVLLTECEKELW